MTVQDLVEPAPDRGDGTSRKGSGRIESLLADLSVRGGNTIPRPFPHHEQGNVITRKGPEFGIDAEEIGWGGGPHASFLVELAQQRLREALATAHAAAGQEPVLGAALLVPAEEDSVVPAEDRRHAHARLGPHRSPDEPNPPTPRSVTVTSSVSTTSTSATGTTSS